MLLEPETDSQDVLTEDEPKYLRRQKPVEVRRRKFGRQQRAAYLRLAVITMSVLAALTAVAVGVDFALHAAMFRLDRPEQIAFSGQRQVPVEALLEKFSADRGRSLLLLPLEQRRRALEEIPWIEHARIERILPDRLRVEIVERTPVAFLRTANDLLLIDAQGVLLERPLRAEFQFPVITGLTEAMPREERERRIKLYLDFMNEAQQAFPAASASVSELDLADANDVRVTLAGLPELASASESGAPGQETVLVHFGAGDFGSKFRVFLENLPQWRASVGRIESVDLRFDRQVVVNPETAQRASADKKN